MENIAQMVDESLARHGVEPTFDHLRLQWSKWFRCDSSFSVLLTPAKPGIFALGEEITSEIDGNKRMLALFQISETDDLGMTLGRLFLPGSPLRTIRGWMPARFHRPRNASSGTRISFRCGLPHRCWWPGARRRDRMAQSFVRLIL